MMLHNKKIYCEIVVGLVHVYRQWDNGAGNQLKKRLLSLGSKHVPCNDTYTSELQLKWLDIISGGVNCERLKMIFCILELSTIQFTPSNILYSPSFSSFFHTGEDQFIREDSTTNES